MTKWWHYVLNAIAFVGCWLILIAIAIPYKIWQKTVLPFKRY